MARQTPRLSRQPLARLGHDQHRTACAADHFIGRAANKVACESCGPAQSARICGQAPSDFPEFAEWLVGLRVDSISLNPDTAVKTALRIAAAEQLKPVLVTASPLQKTG